METQHLTLRIVDLYRRATSIGLVATQVAELATLLAHSGHTRTRDPDAANLASTGGPGSMSTLIVPLMLRHAGLTVPKIGVPGRPAGGVDVLASIPGYESDLDVHAFDAALERCGYAHTLANESWAPADAELFALRGLEGTKALPALAVASLLSKKSARGSPTLHSRRESLHTATSGAP